jgi:hypothetical protein
MKLWELLLNVAAILVFASMAASSWLGQSWGSDWIELAFGFGGTVVCLFPYEATEYSGHWGWSHSQWRIPPVGWIKFMGIVLLLIGACSLFTESQWLENTLSR